MKDLLLVVHRTEAEMEQIEGSGGYNRKSLLLGNGGNGGNGGAGGQFFANGGAGGAGGF